MHALGASRGITYYIVEMTPLQKQITDYLKQTPGPIQAHTLARRLKLGKHELTNFDKSVSALVRAGTIRTNKKGRLFWPNANSTATGSSPSNTEDDPNLLQGVLQRTPNGAWFIPDRSTDPVADAAASSAAPVNDVFIYPENIGDAQNNDRVSVRIQKRRRGGGKPVGQIDKVIQRATHEFVGTYIVKVDEAKVQIDGTAFEKPVSVGDPGAKGTQPGDKVIVEIVRFPTLERAGSGVIARILGKRGAPGIDTQSIIHEFGLPNSFSQEVLDAARHQAELFDDASLTDRVDLTKETIVTIDPVDARDFDDAISLKRTRDGHWHLAVHIADVSHFVQPGSVLDDEAKRRGTSVYLPGQVIPMLPEIISNGLASLQQGQVRFTKSVFIEFSDTGTPLATDFANTAIKVKHRFAYEEVMPLVTDPDAFKGQISEPVRKLVVRMHEFGMLLRKRRFADGAIELHLPEVKIELDKDGVVIGANESHYDESHQLIEEFMLAANIAVATELFNRDQAVIRRIHSKADRSKLQSLADFVESLGLKLDNCESRVELQKLVQAVRGKPYEQAVNYALLRSMKQAEYAATDEGHYALGVDHYCHFTSPIRRYPDLTIHRVIDQHIKRNPKSGKQADTDHSSTPAPFKKSGQSPSDLFNTATHCSTTERRAAHAERELVRVKLIALMEKQPSDIFDAIITKVQRFGVSCRCVKFPVDGFIQIGNLVRNDFLDFDRATSTMTARRSGKQFRLGDPVQVKVAIADPDKRILQWSLVDSNSKSVKAGSGKSDKWKSRDSGAENNPKRSKNKKNKDKRSNSSATAEIADAGGIKKKKKPKNAKRKKKRKPKQA